MHIKEEIVSSRAKQIMKEFIDSIPEVMCGADRVNYIISKSTAIAFESRAILKNVIDKILKVMVELKASDIDFGGHGARQQIWLRINKEKEPVPGLPCFNDDEIALLILSLLNSNKQKLRLKKMRNLDFSYSIKTDERLFGDFEKNTFTKYEDKIFEVRFRGDIYFDLDKLAMNMRSINPYIRRFDTLGFHDNVQNLLSFCYVKHGLNLVTGVTGSGKSTTLDSIICWNNRHVKGHIVIIASPVEYVHKSEQCIVRHREVGRDVLTFKEGVIQALRQDLDMMVISEMRDPDTILAALEVTDTGHKVFSTLHTVSAIESIDRIVAEADEREQDRIRLRLADVLSTIISQKLVPGIDGKLILAKEILVVNQNVRAAIRNNKTSEIYMMINQGTNLGMVTMEQDLKRLTLEGKISIETAIQYANNKIVFKQIMGMI